MHNIFRYAITFSYLLIILIKILHPFTAHTTNVVPLIVTNSHVGLKEGGKLGDLAPTMLQLLGLPIPEEMDGESLLK